MVNSDEDALKIIARVAMLGAIPRCELSPFHSKNLVRVISSWPDASSLWKRFVSD